MHQLRHTFRSLGRARTLSVVAVLSVGLGTALSVLVAMVLRQSILLTPTLPEADRIISVMVRGYDDCRECPDLFDAGIARRWGAHPLRSIASFGLYRETDLLLEKGTGTTRISAAAIRGDLFHTLGATAAAGRLPDAIELAEGDPSLAVISEAFAARQGFTPVATAIGAHLTLSGRTVTIVGVLSKGHGVPASADLWLTDRLFAAPGGGAAHVYSAIARLRDGATVTAAERELNELGFDQVGPVGPGHAVSTAWVTTLAEKMRWNNGQALPLLVAAAIATLLLATANLQSLLIVRAIDNSGATAIRIALGATTRDLVQSLAMESGVLCWLGMLPAIGAVLIGRIVLAPYLASEWGRPVALTFDPLSITTLLCLPPLMALAGLLAPAWHVGTFSLRAALQEESSGLSASRKQVRFRMIFVVAQVAVAVVLVVAAGLLIRAYSSLEHIDVGYDPDRVAVAQLDLTGTRYDDWTRAGEWSSRVLAELPSRNREIAAYWVGNAPSLAVGPHDPWTTLEGAPAPSGMRRLFVEYHVSGEFFNLFGLHATRGRLFNPGDRLGATPVIVINELAAKAWWPGKDPIGQRIKLGPETSAMPWLMVVGVIPNTESFDESGLWFSSVHPGHRFLKAFLPFEQSRTDRFGAPLPLSRVNIGASIVGPPPLALASLRQSLQRIGGELPPVEVRTLREIQQGSGNFPQILIAERALSGLAGLALLLAAIGLFGVISENTRMRTAEIGIRRALGAAAADITWLAARPALAALGYGVALAVAIGTAFSRTLLYGFFGVTSQNRFGLLLSVSPGDSAALSISIVVLAGAVALALVGPVRRAIAIEPMRALRHRR